MNPAHHPPLHGLEIVESFMNTNQTSEWMHLLLDRHADGVLGNKIALIEADTGLSISYAELRAKVSAVADAFTDLGLMAGDLVFAVAGERIDLVAILLAALLKRAVVANLNAQFAAADYAGLLTQMRPQWVIFDDAAANFRQACVASIGGQALPQPLPGTAFERLPAYPRQSPGTTSGPQYAGAVCLFTSGSTGAPKPVLHSVTDLLLTNRHYAAQVLELSEDDILFSTSKMSFAYGLNSIHFALYRGATAVLAPRQAQPEALCESIARYRVSVCFSVPTVYRRMLEKAWDRLPSLATVRTWVSAGEPLPRQLSDLWVVATGSDIIDGIGSTETLSTYISNRKGAVVRGSAGREVSGFECTLRDAQGEPVADGQWGTLHVRGATIASGYWNDARTTATSFRDGWLMTNDVFYRDAAGYYFFVGRANDVFKSGANWISPPRIEQVLAQHPDVLDCAVVPLQEMGGLNRIKAYVVVRDARDHADWQAALTDELVAFSRARLARHEYPHYIEFIAELPRSVNGKLQRAQLRT